MKPLSTHRITKFVAAAALAGLSIVSAYAAPSEPNYLTPIDSPIDVTTITSAHVGGSVSSQLNKFNTYLEAIKDQLEENDALGNAVANDTLRTPNLTDGVGGPFLAATDLNFIEAVKQAVVASPTDTDGIITAAVLYKPAKIQSILTAVAAAQPDKAAIAVAAAAAANPGKAGSAATGAILGLISLNTVPNNELADEAAAAAVIEGTRTLIEGVAKAAVASTKKANGAGSGQQLITAKAVAHSMLDTFLTQAASSNAELYIDDIARGAILGAKGFTDVTQAQMAAELIAVISLPAHAALKTEKNVVNLSMGAVQGAAVVGGFADAVKTAIVTALTPGALADAVTIGARFNIAIRNGVDKVVAFDNELTSADYSNIYAAISGAVQGSKGKVADYVTKAFDVANRPVGPLFTTDMQKDIVAAAVTGNMASVSKIVTAAIAAGATASDAVKAAIPAATDGQSGMAVLAAIKNNQVALSAAAAQGVLDDAITAAVTAGYNRALPGMALNAVKARKDIDNELVTTAITAVPIGWEEAVAAFIVANNPKDVIPSALNTNKTSAIAAADAANIAPLGPKFGLVDVDGVKLAVELAIRAKSSSKTQFDDAVASLTGVLPAVGLVPETTVSGAGKTRAVLFGIGAANTKLAVPLMAATLRANGPDSSLLDYAISLNQKGAAATTLAYQTAQDVIAHPDNIFDVVDHQILTNPKAGAEILSAAVAARPEYAHYSARAAAFRAPALVGKIATAAIQYAHMRTNPADDPAAVAAISAATVLGLIDAKQTSAKTTALMTAAITGLVKGTMSFSNTYAAGGKDDKNGLQGNAVGFPEATGAGPLVTDVKPASGPTAVRSKGSAGVITGAIAQLQAEGATTLSALSITAITAAGKAAKAHALAIAQAAGAAAQAVAAAGGQVFAGFTAIANALSSTGVSGLENAARVGAAQFTAGTYGAGYAGLWRTGPYSHHSGSGDPVTNLLNF